MAGYSCVRSRAWLRSRGSCACRRGRGRAAATSDRRRCGSGRERDEFHGTFFSGRLRPYGGDDGALQSLNVPALALGAAHGGVASDVLSALQHNLKNETLPAGRRRCVQAAAQHPREMGCTPPRSMSQQERKPSGATGFSERHQLLGGVAGSDGRVDVSKSRISLRRLRGMAVAERGRAASTAQASPKSRHAANRPADNNHDGDPRGPGPASVTGTLRTARGVFHHGTSRAPAIACG